MKKLQITVRAESASEIFTYLIAQINDVYLATSQQLQSNPNTASGVITGDRKSIAFLYRDEADAGGKK